METFFGFIGGVIIAITPFLWKKYFSRPEVTIEIINDRGMSSFKGLSRKNVIEENGHFDERTSIRVFEVTWWFKIKITNNSDLTAFYPELMFSPNGPSLDLIDKIHPLQPIKPTETIILRAEYVKIEEKTGEERTSPGKQTPEEFSQLKLLLKYQNSHKIKFYTVFDFNKQINRFSRKNPH